MQVNLITQGKPNWKPMAWCVIGKSMYIPSAVEEAYALGEFEPNYPVPAPWVDVQIYPSFVTVDYFHKVYKHSLGLCGISQCTIYHKNCKRPLNKRTLRFVYVYGDA